MEISLNTLGLLFDLIGFAFLFFSGNTTELFKDVPNFDRSIGGTRTDEQQAETKPKEKEYNSLKNLLKRKINRLWTWNGLGFFLVMLGFLMQIIYSLGWVSSLSCMVA